MGAAARVASVADGRFGPKRALTGSARATFAKQPQSCRASAPPLPRVQGKLFLPMLLCACCACAAPSAARCRPR